MRGRYDCVKMSRKKERAGSPPAFGVGGSRALSASTRHPPLAKLTKLVLTVFTYVSDAGMGCMLYAGWGDPQCSTCSATHQIVQ